MGIVSEGQKRKLREEIYLKNLILVEGVSFDPAIFSNLDLGGEYIEQVNVLFSQDRHAHGETEFPAAFFTPGGGYITILRWNRDSPLSLRYEDGQYNLYNVENILMENVQFGRRPGYYGQKTSDGTLMRTVAVDYGCGAMFVAYSNECVLKEKGLECLFCNINATKAIYGEAQDIKWKTPKQVGETIAAGYREGFDHVTISGGFVPERREVEYYIDVAEAIQDHTGLPDFNGTACVGAPLDLSVFEKYREAGYRTIATNLEIWNDKMFEVICPGKSQLCGGRGNWLAAIDEELRVFGKHRVRSTFVTGIEPRQSVLEGLEYLSEKGVVVVPSQWYVNVGSSLEGCRTPGPEWHMEIFEKVAGFYRKYGFTWDEIRDACASTDLPSHDLFRLDQDIQIEDIRKTNLQQASG
jgi:hypothetical protein